MTTTLLDCPAEAPRELAWSPLLALHAVPAAVTVGGAMLIAPLLRTAGWPAWSVLALAVVLLLVPISLGVLLRASHRLTGRWSLGDLPYVWACRSRLTHVLATPTLAVGGMLMLQVNGYSSQPTGWVFPAADVTVTVVIMIVLVTALVDGIINPLVEEFTRQGAGTAALASAQRYWQPENLLFTLILQAVIAYAVVQAGAMTITSVANGTAAALRALSQVLGG